MRHKQEISPEALSKEPTKPGLRYIRVQHSGHNAKIASIPPKRITPLHVCLYIKSKFKGLLVLKVLITNTISKNNPVIIVKKNFGIKTPSTYLSEIARTDIVITHNTPTEIRYVMLSH